MQAEVRKLGHIGLETVPGRSTLSDANARRSERFFEMVYRDLYEQNKAFLSSDSRRHEPEIGRAHVLNSSHANISYAVFCLKKKTTQNLPYLITIKKELYP